MDKHQGVQINVEWDNEKEFPEEISKSNPRFSVDVLVYNPKTKERTIGWFDYLDHKWCFLCREVNKKFFWRYFIDNIDKYEKNSRKQRNQESNNN